VGGCVVRAVAVSSALIGCGRVRMCRLEYILVLPHHKCPSSGPRAGGWGVCNFGMQGERRVAGGLPCGRCVARGPQIDSKVRGVLRGPRPRALRRGFGGGAAPHLLKLLPETVCAGVQELAVEASSAATANFMAPRRLYVTAGLLCREAGDCAAI
jgi:hypothetical protein